MNFFGQVLLFLHHTLGLLAHRGLSAATKWTRSPTVLRSPLSPGALGEREKLFYFSLGRRWLREEAG